MAATIPRYLVETGPTAIEAAFRDIPALCAKHGITSVTLVVPKKGGWDRSLVAEFLGQSIAKTLLKGGSATFGKNGPTLKLESPTTFSTGGAPGLIVGAHISDKDMAKIDDCPTATAILYLPWDDLEGRAWQATWQPETIGPSTWSVPADTLSTEVEHALTQLTQLINLGTGLSHPSDKAHAVRTIAKLRSDGHFLDLAKIKNWALRHGWSSDAAAELEKIAS